MVTNVSISTNKTLLVKNDNERYHLEYKYGAAGEDRTHDLRLTKTLLYH